MRGSHVFRDPNIEFFKPMVVVFPNPRMILHHSVLVDRERKEKVSVKMADLSGQQRYLTTENSRLDDKLMTSL